MMDITTNPIQAVLFDMGGTLEDLYGDDAIRRESIRGLRALLRQRSLDPGLSLQNLQSTVASGFGAYHSWRDQSEIELPPDVVWSEYVLVDHCTSRERLSASAEEIAMYWESHNHTRSLRPEAPATLDALEKRGFRLAIISNVNSRGLVPCKLAEYGIAHYFDPVVTSSCLGWRKPNERIFDEATRLMQLPPTACAYVGDTVSRDVIGARRAGYGLAIQIRSFLTDRSDQGTDHVPPDAVIQDLSEVVDLVTLNREAFHDE
jgi:putative hydrolase of the HAD superfamily